MITESVLHDIRTNINTGIEYEIALFYQLLRIKPSEQKDVMRAIEMRHDSSKVKEIISFTSVDKIIYEVEANNRRFEDVSFETQNDNIGPADVVLYGTTIKGERFKIGLSVKFANTCTLNVTGRKFITDEQISGLKKEYENTYVPLYIKDMTKRFGDASNWHRKTSTVTDEMIDKIRDAVIQNWPNIKDKTTLLKNLFHAESPIEFWVVKYVRNGYILNTVPSTIDMRYADQVRVEKYQTSYVAFYLGKTRVGHMQVKFNNGFIERNTNHKGERKRQTPDFVRDNIEFIYGQPFGSWNFSVEE